MLNKPNLNSIPTQQHHQVVLLKKNIILLLLFRLFFIHHMHENLSPFSLQWIGVYTYYPDIIFLHYNNDNKLYKKKRKITSKISQKTECEWNWFLFLRIGDDDVISKNLFIYASVKVFVDEHWQMLKYHHQFSYHPLMVNST